MQQNQINNKEQESTRDKDNKEELLEDSIEQLNKYLSDLKKDRQRTEKDQQLLNYRNKILNYEESKAAKKLELVAKNQEKKEKIRVNIDKDKKIMQDKKKNDMAKLEKQKSKNSTMKTEIDKSLKNWKPNVAKKNKGEADKVKEEREQIKSLINETKEKNNNLNKDMHDSVQLSHLQKAEQKRMEDYQKKLQLKKEIEEQIQKELALKNQLEGKINEQQKKNQEIMDRIKNYNDTNSKGSQKSIVYKNKTPRMASKTQTKIENKKK